MKCNVCGTEVNAGQKCHVCGFTPVDMASLPEAFRSTMNDMVVNFRTMALKDIKVFLQIYYWEKVDDQLTEKKRERLLVQRDLGSVEPETVVWCDTEFAKQTSGETKELSVIVESAGREKTYTASLVAPATGGTWRVGFVLKPGFQFVLRVGDDRNYSETNVLSLKG